MAQLRMDKEFARRYVNDGFSGGEMKRAEILQLAMLRPEFVSPAVLALVSEDAPTRTILCAGGGGFEMANITLTQGIHIPGDPPSADTLLARLTEVADRTGEAVPNQGFVQSQCELKKAGFVAPQTAVRHVQAACSTK